jgi:hypothetical protein
MADGRSDSAFLVLPPALDTPTPQMARAILRMKLTPRDQRRITQLCEANQRGKLKQDQRDELDWYLHLGNLLTLLHAKARNSLKRGSSRARRKSA